MNYLASHGGLPLLDVRIDIANRKAPEDMHHQCQEQDEDREDDVALRNHTETDDTLEAETVHDATVELGHEAASDAIDDLHRRGDQVGVNQVIEVGRDVAGEHAGLGVEALEDLLQQRIVCFDIGIELSKAALLRLYEHFPCAVGMREHLIINPFGIDDFHVG
eukprot:CAMPEP_0177261956 /NCGR_PEP_ID=MMETSP0367-20130122/60111_1 /TAXON_ID=447022 ORGANISM="Scrippsiella hangoei-like, Strain SHHI-4" /NCGR_SAMPLE_ID=MMETSP0367 /ASSEMBLY_ACC=CAM_ASM_000362 /LENGTH=162 /DNA_ID=CAMNT_0018716661 /DNA_START=203 /DNA_END=687 /DNA_ORIENTATION=-